jgi:hypothetical protein
MIGDAEHAIQEQKAIAGKLQRRFELETPDPAWARDMSASLKDEIAGANLEHVVVDRPRCAGTVCELALRYDSDVDRNAVIVKLSELPSFRGGAYYQYDRTTNQTNVYVAREGKPVFAELAN